MKKIMFNDRYCLTQAVIERRKTMTRRIVTPPKDANGIDWDGDRFRIIGGKGGYVTPEYRIGEIVAVAQRYEQIGANPQYYVSRPEIDGYQIISKHKGWRNKMYVRAELMPHQIRITGVRAERLQDISDVDAANEGIRAIRSADDGRMAWGFTDDKLHSYLFDTPRAAFASLIDKVSGKGTWERNPWVWVYEFELVK